MKIYNHIYLEKGEKNREMRKAKLDHSGIQ